MSKRNKKKTPADSEAKIEQRSEPAQPETPKPTASFDSNSPWPILLLVVAIFGIVGGIFLFRQQSQGERIVDEAIALIQQDRIDDARLQASKLEGLSEYKLHLRTLRGAILVSENRVSEAEALLGTLPDEPRIRSFGLFYRGTGKFRKDEIRSAQEDFVEAFDNDPENLESRDSFRKTQRMLKNRKQPEL